MRLILDFFILVIFLLSCRADTEPKVYDKTKDIIEQEAEFIHHLIRNDNFSDAESAINKNLALYPDNVELLTLQGWLFLQKKDYIESEKIFLNLIEKNKKNPLAYAGLSRLYRFTNKYDKSEEYVESGLSISKDFPILWFEKGMNQFKNKKYNESIISFTKSYNLDKENIDASFFKYLAQLYSGYEINDIKHSWENIVKLGKARNYHYLYHAEALYLLGKKDLCFSILKDSVNKYPNDRYLLNFYSLILTEKYKLGETDNLDEAILTIEKCINSDKDIEPEFIDTYLQILEITGQHEKIKEIINKYYLIFPDSPDIIGWIKKLE